MSRRHKRTGGFSRAVPLHPLFSFLLFAPPRVKGVCKGGRGRGRRISYSSCHVSYTDPTTATTIEYTYTPRDADQSGQVLEINEKVSSREEARQLAMKRLRQKNKEEFKASFSLAGDARLAAGITVLVSGYGAFDGKYIIETATHSVSRSGYKTDITLRRALEGY